MLAVARALMGEPRLLLVDEASMGLAPTMVSAIFRLLEKVRETGVTLCLVEQSPAVLDIANRAFVMAQGQVATRADAEGVSAIKDEVAGVYLGSGERR